MTTSPTVHDIADALIMLAGLVAAERVTSFDDPDEGIIVRASAWESERICAGLYELHEFRCPPGDGHWAGRLLTMRMDIYEVPSTILADSFDADVPE